MVICCPFCGRSGVLPEGLRDGVHAVRCRRCKSRFWTSSDSADSDSHVLTRRGLGDQGGPGDSGLGEWSAIEDDDSVEIELGSSDSHYELPVMTSRGHRKEGDGEGDSVGEGDRAGAGSASGEWPVWVYRSAAIWNRVQLQAALVLGCASLLVVGYLLTCALWSGWEISASASLLVVGLLGTMGFVWLSLVATRLFVLLEDLSRALNRLAPEDFQASEPDRHPARESVEAWSDERESLASPAVIRARGG